MQHPQSSERNDSSKLKLLFHLGSWDYLPRRREKTERRGEKYEEFKVLTWDKEKQRKTWIKSLHPKTSVSPFWQNHAVCFIIYQMCLLGKYARCLRLFSTTRELWISEHKHPGPPFSLAFVFWIIIRCTYARWIGMSVVSVCIYQTLKRSTNSMNPRRWIGWLGMFLLSVVYL